MNDRDLTAYCGLHCGGCIRFQCRASGLSAQLLDELARCRFQEYAKAKRHHAQELEHYGPMIAALEVISELKCEVPCRLGGDGCNGSCRIIPCVKEKAIEGCWECAEFEACGKLDFLKLLHGDAPLKNLRKIKEYGIDAWAGYQEKCYPWL
jgi:hypothetical protein